MNNALETVKGILAEKVDISNLKEDDPLSTIGLDSLDLVEIMIQIEDVVGCEFTSDEIKNLKTLKDVVALINSKSK